MDDKEPFLSRWSRRKLQATAHPPDALPAAGLPVAGAAAPRVLVTEPTTPGSPQGIRPEYREFFDPQMDERLRQTALRTLFGDPRFNIMDGLDTYIDDYSRPEGIPEAMLQQLNQAKELFPFDDETRASGRAVDEAPRASGEDSAASQAIANPGAMAEPAAANASALGAGASGCAAPAPREGGRND